MKATVFIKCPHCGHENKAGVEITSTIMPWQVWFCDYETGGCEKQFAVMLMADPQARVAPIGHEMQLGSVMHSKVKKKR